LGVVATALRVRLGTGVLAAAAVAAWRTTVIGQNGHGTLGAETVADGVIGRADRVHVTIAARRSASIG